MGLVDDPISGVLSAFFQHAAESKVLKYAILVLEMGIAASIAFLSIAGGSLMANQAIAWSMGAGMVAAAIAMLATFGASPNAKGLVIAVQKDITQQESNTPITTIKEK